MRKLLLSAPLLLAACGGPTTDTPDAETAPADAAPPDAYVPGPNAVTVTASGATYVAYRDGAGPWLAAKHLTGDDYQLDVTDDYRVIVSCGAPGGFDVEESAFTFGDGAAQYAYCFASPVAANLGGSDAIVSGQMLQPGSVWLGQQVSGSTSPWPFSIDMGPPGGTYDLVASSADRALIRRGVTVTGDMTVPDVDADTEGLPLETHTIAIDGAAADAVYANVSWYVTGSSAWFTSYSADVQVPPASLVSPNDAEFLDVDAITGNTDRHASLEFVGSPPDSLAMLPALDGVTFVTDHGGDLAKFTSLPAFDRLYFYAFDVDDTSMMIFSATPSWFAATQARAVGFADVPADLDFQIDPTTAHYRELDISKDADHDITYDSLVYDQVGGVTQQPPLAQMRRLAAARHAREKAAMKQR